jgi:hypothetical protein
VMMVTVPIGQQYREIVLRNADIPNPIETTFAGGGTGVLTGQGSPRSTKN